MNSDERNLLSRFLDDLTAARGVQKDAEADQMINSALRASPDAPYVLVQHAILSDQALHQAQQQIATLQDQLRQLAPAAAPGGFLPGGGQQSGPWNQQGPYQSPPQQAGGFMGQGPFRSGGGLGSFLRGAGTLAAGVAGGSLLAEGLSGLFGGGRGGFFGGGGGGAPGEVINNYYDDGGGSGGDWGNGGGDWGGGDSGGGGFDSGGGGDF